MPLLASHTSRSPNPCATRSKTCAPTGSPRLTALHGLPPGLGTYGEDYKRAALVGELPLTAIRPTNAHCLLDRVTVGDSWCPGAGSAIALDVQGTR